MWTSSNSIVFVTIVTYYINGNIKFQTTLIGLRQVIDSHSSKFVGEQVVQVILEYGL